MFPRQAAIAAHRVAVVSRQPRRLAHPTALLNMAQDLDHFPLRQRRIEKDRPFPFGKPPLARPAIQNPFLLVLPIPVAHTQVARPALAVVGALLVLTAEPRQIVHGQASSTGLGTSAASTVTVSQQSSENLAYAYERNLATIFSHKAKNQPRSNAATATLTKSMASSTIASTARPTWNCT